MTEGTIAVELTVPSVWPPKVDVGLFDGIVDGSVISIVAAHDETIRFGVHFEDGQVAYAYATPRLALPDFAVLRVAFSWGGQEGLGCAINGTVFCAPSIEPVRLNAISHPPTDFRKNAVFDIPPRCTDEEQSLLRFTLDLQRRIAVNDRFNLREASAILRRLVLDARPIVHLVNRTHRLKLRYPFVDERHVINVRDRPAFEFVNLCPDFASPADIRLVGLDEFLSIPVLSDPKRSFTVRDVIDVCANLKGGIHFGEPISQTDESLVKLDKDFLPFFLDASFAALPGIGWTVINGTGPLRDAIFRSRK